MKRHTVRVQFSQCCSSTQVLPVCRPYLPNHFLEFFQSFLCKYKCNYLDCSAPCFVLVFILAKILEIFFYYLHIRGFFVVVAVIVVLLK